MKNKIIYILKSKIKLRVKGKNINRFITRLYNNNIEILKCNYINKEEVDIIIYEKDIKKLKEIKTIYDVDKINTYGLIKIKKHLDINKYIIISLTFGYILLRILTNIIFNVEIIHNDEKTRQFIKNELSTYGIKEKTIKKSYNEIQKIKEQILNKYKDKIEWLEIEEKGTKYVVRLELRIIKEKQEQKKKQNIIAKKDSIIKEIQATSGQIVKDINNYVKKGEVVISGNIYDNEIIKDTVPAEGKVFGEVWYEVTVSYPFAYAEEKETGKKKTIYTLKLLNKNIELFNLKPFKNKKIKEKVLLKNNIIPIQLAKQQQKEIEKTDQILTIDEASKLALEKAQNIITEKLKEKEYIINYKILNTNIKESELELKIFFSVYEDITDYEIIIEEENKE